MRSLALPPTIPYRLLAGVGGIGAGYFFALEGNHTLGRNESRPARLLEWRDYCKLHIIAHYVAVLLGADPSGEPFHVLPIGRVGRDATGERLLQEMRPTGMDLHLVARDPDHPTLLSACFQYPDGSGGNITAHNAAAGQLTPAEVDAAEPFLATAAGRALALAVPEVPLAARLRLLQMATRHGALRIGALTVSEVEGAQALGLLRYVDLLAVNEDEAAALSGTRFDAERPGVFLDSCAKALQEQQPGVRIVVTAGRHGAYAFDGRHWDHCPAAEVPVASTAGAGDALLAGILCGLVAGLPFIAPGAPRSRLADRPLSSALDLGVLLASLSVTSPHTINPEADAPALLRLSQDLGLPLTHRFETLLASS